MSTTWWRLKDDGSQDGGLLLTDYKDCESWNEKGYGIFWTHNEFKENTRRISNLLKINNWVVEMDREPKHTQMARIKEAPLLPSMVIESKNGYHCYWAAKNATHENYREIAKFRLVPYFAGDPKCIDVTRVLRAPDFNHMKDPKKPYPVRIVHWDSVTYSEEEMRTFFPLVEDKTETESRKSLPTKIVGSTFWDAVYSLDAEAALNHLSGTSHVNGETFTFRRTSGGKQNIFVNGKGTSCFIDREGRIGSFDGGGPSIAQWLKWYGHDWTEVVRIIKDEFGIEG